MQEDFTPKQAHRPASPSQELPEARTGSQAAEESRHDDQRQTQAQRVDKRQEGALQDAHALRGQQRQNAAKNGANTGRPSQ